MKEDVEGHMGSFSRGASGGGIRRYQFPKYKGIVRANYLLPCCSITKGFFPFSWILDFIAFFVDSLKRAVLEKNLTIKIDSETYFRCLTAMSIV